MKIPNFTIRQCSPVDYQALADLTVSVYSALPDMPSPEIMPEYYQLLADTAARAATPTTQIFAAYDQLGELVGGVTFIGDMAYYGSGGTAPRINNAAGFRLLAVSPRAQGLGIGKAITLFCIDKAKSLQVEQLVMHTTRSMLIAWKMYEKLGFEAMPEIDFEQSGLAVYGFRKKL